MKYRVLLLGMNKVIIDEFFDHLQEFFDAQTTSVRSGDMDCHIKYFKPDAIIFCMHNETPDMVNAMLDYKLTMQDHGIPLVIVGSQKECDDFEKSTHRMSRLVLTKPISGKGIKEKVYELLESMKVPKHGEDEPVKPVAVEAPPEEKAVDKLVEQVMASSISVSMEEQIKKMVESAEESSVNSMPETQKTRQAEPEKPVKTHGEEMMGMPAIGQTSYTEEMQKKVAEMVQKELTATEQKQQQAAVQTQETSQPQEAVQPQMEAAPARKHVLVVDDDPMMLKLIKEQLKDNYAVGTAVSGHLAMKFLENKKTDLIILDYEMPLENGAMVLKRIRRNPELSKLPVIFLTGVSAREKIKQVVDLKPQGYLLKPIEKEKLIAIIKKIIG